MAKQSGMGDLFLIDGFNLSGDIGSLSRIGGGPAAGEVTAINKEAFERLGLKRDGVMEFASWFNKATGQSHPALSILPTSSRYAMYLRGSGIGNQAASLYGTQIDYAGNRAEDGSFPLTSSVLGNGFGLEWGEQLTAGMRTDTAATSPATGLDGGASTTFGGQAYLQVESITGTSVTVRIQDSADNSTFANIAGGGLFSAASARGAQRIEITGTIRRYTRAITTGIFSEAIFAVQFTRNATATVF